ncbi:hypothetical protein SUDANB126_03048 [Streptomyces sp. enrichment culture]
MDGADALLRPVAAPSFRQAVSERPATTVRAATVTLVTPAAGEVPFPTTLVGARAASSW